MSTWDPRHPTDHGRSLDDPPGTLRPPGKRTRTQSIGAARDAVSTSTAGRSTAAGASTTTSAPLAAGSAATGQNDPFDFSYVADSQPFTGGPSGGGGSDGSWETDPGVDAAGGSADVRADAGQAGGEYSLTEDVLGRIQNAIDEATNIIESAVEIPFALTNMGWQLILWSDQALQGHGKMDFGYVMYGNTPGGGSESDDAGMGPSKDCHPDFDGPPPSRFGGFKTSDKQGWRQAVEIFKFSKQWWEKFAKQMGWVSKQDDNFASEPTTLQTTTPSVTTGTTAKSELETTKTNVIPAAAEDGSGNIATTDKKHSQWSVKSDRTIDSGVSRTGSVEASTPPTKEFKQYVGHAGYVGRLRNVRWNDKWDGWMGPEGGPRLAYYEDGSIEIVWYANCEFVKVIPPKLPPNTPLPDGMEVGE